MHLTQDKTQVIPAVLFWSSKVFPDDRRTFRRAGRIAFRPNKKPDISIRQKVDTTLKYVLLYLTNKFLRKIGEILKQWCSNRGPHAGHMWPAKQFSLERKLYISII